MPSLSDSASDSPPQNLRERINDRAHELAVLALRIPPLVVQSDYEQAKRDLTGESDPERQFAMINRSARPGEPFTRHHRNFAQ